MPNKARKTGNDVWIDVGNGRESVVDEADYWGISGYTWHAYPANAARAGVYYVKSQAGYLHRFIMNAPKGRQVDHINHDTLDNRRANLRVVNNQENNANRDGAYNTSRTGIRGVSTHRCKPSGLMYVFRCHIATCKTAKYFPHTEQGLADAIACATEHYAKVEA